MFKSFSVSRSGCHEVVIANVWPTDDLFFVGRKTLQKVRIVICSSNPSIPLDGIEREVCVPPRISRSAFVKEHVDPFASEVLSSIDW